MFWSLLNYYEFCFPLLYWAVNQFYWHQVICFKTNVSWWMLLFLSIRYCILHVDTHDIWHAIMPGDGRGISVVPWCCLHVKTSHEDMSRLFSHNGVDLHHTPFLMTLTESWVSLHFAEAARNCSLMWYWQHKGGRRERCTGLGRKTWRNRTHGRWCM
jgi:hypothetical protein